MSTDSSSSRFNLRDLSLPSRVVIAVFMLAVGVGYFSALVQLHFQHAKAGELLPTPDDAADAYGGLPGKGQLERLIVASEDLPFTGTGSMRPAFTTRSAGWLNRVRDRARLIPTPKEEKKDDEKKDDGKKDDEKKEEKKLTERDLDRATKELRAERHLEADSLVAWIHAGGKQSEYGQFLLPEKLEKQFPKEIGDDLAKFFQRNQQGRVVGNIESIISTRCYRCHREGATGSEGEIHLDKFEVVQDYLLPERGGGMSLRKLAQSTHAHLLTFCVLFGLTGFVFSCTSWPAAVRLGLAPFTLIMQVVDISFWWLARLDEPLGPMFGKGIAVTGGLVAMSLMAQIFGTLATLFGKHGLILLAIFILLGLGALAGVYFLVIGPYLINEGLGRVLP